MNFGKLHNICSAKIESFAAHGEWNAEGRYFFKDNGADVLAVAHLDTVVPCTHVKKVVLPHDTIIYSPVLDDRLGVYTILDLLPKLGLKYDVLLTTDEEIGKSTGENFKPPKQYNWMFQFDRAGTDVVMYDYETTALLAELKKYGFTTGLGTFSDISSMEHLNCVGYNFGVGYHEQHSYNSWASIKELAKMVELFQKFFTGEKDNPKPHEPVDDYYKTYQASKYMERYDYGNVYEYDRSGKWTQRGKTPSKYSTDYIQCELCDTIILKEDIWTSAQYDAFDAGCCDECYLKIMVSA